MVALVADVVDGVGVEGLDVADVLEEIPELEEVEATAAVDVEGLEGVLEVGLGNGGLSLTLDELIHGPPGFVCIEGAATVGVVLGEEFPSLRINFGGVEVVLVGHVVRKLAALVTGLTELSLGRETWLTEISLRREALRIERRLSELSGLSELSRLPELTRLSELSRLPELSRLSWLPELTGLSWLPELSRLSWLSKLSWLARRSLGRKSIMSRWKRLARLTCRSLGREALSWLSRLARSLRGKGVIS